MKNCGVHPDGAHPADSTRRASCRAPTIRSQTDLHRCRCRSGTSHRALLPSPPLRQSRSRLVAGLRGPACAARDRSSRRCRCARELRSAPGTNQPCAREPVRLDCRGRHRLVARGNAERVGRLRCTGEGPDSDTDGRDERTCFMAARFCHRTVDHDRPATLDHSTEAHRPSTMTDHRPR